MLCRNPCGLYVHLAFTYSIGPSSVVWIELGLAMPFPPMRALAVWWSWALNLMCKVALRHVGPKLDAYSWMVITRVALRRWHRNNMCSDEIGFCAQNKDTILSSIVNTMGKAYVITQMSKKCSRKKLNSIQYLWIKLKWTHESKKGGHRSLLVLHFDLILLLHMNFDFETPRSTTIFITSNC